MLSEQSASIVEATLPVVRDHAEAITANFYPRMFAAHPGLLNLFNRGNQATGAQRQALAGAVVAYAGHLLGDASVPLAPVLERIAHKHASLGIRPDQYPIVGRHLLDAVGAVLGDAVTPAVRAAWDEVYWLFACELVAREARLYQGAGVGDPDRIWRPWQVATRTAETADVTSFWLVPADGGPVPRFTPGQYVSVAVDLDGGRGRQIRQYSLCGAPDDGVWRIAVKRTRGSGGAPDGAVSTWLHDRVAVGDVLPVSPPFGEVSAVPGTGPLVLVSAGIGVTPAMSALEHLACADPERPVVLVHADHGVATHPLRARLAELHTDLKDLRVQLWYEHGVGSDGSASFDDDPLATVPVRLHAGLVDPDLIALPDGADVHLCGPVPFMNRVRAGLLRRGVAPERIAYEVFGPDMLRAHDHR